MQNVDISIVNAVSRKDMVAVNRLLSDVGMRRREPRKMRRAIDASQAVAIARHENDLVGFGRLVGDGAYYGSLWDIAVVPAFQRQGLGNRLVDALLYVARKQKLQIVGLFTNANNRVFYERLGFQMLSNLHPMTARLKPRSGQSDHNE